MKRITGRYNAVMNTTKPAITITPELLAGIGQEIGRNFDFRVNPDGSGSFVDGPAIALLALLDQIVRLSLETSLPPFHISRRTVKGHGGPDWRHGELRHVELKTATPNLRSPASAELAALLQTLNSSGAALGPFDPMASRLQYAPHIGLLLDVFLAHHMSACQGHKRNEPVGDTGLIKAEIDNDFVARFRQSMLERKLLRRERHNWNLGSRENAGTLTAYLHDLFVKHDSVTVLHLRLFHTRERASLLSASAQDQHLDLLALRTCRAKFFDRMRRKPALFTDEPGYAWAILPSLTGGYDLHLTLLFDTAALQKMLDDRRVEAEHTGAVLEDHADQVGEYWVKGATGGRGSYLRGDRNPWLYGPDWVHGKVRADDRVRLGKLTEMLSYLAMRRALVRLKNEPAGVYFRTPDRKARPLRRPSKTVQKERQSRAPALGLHSKIGIQNT
ncbi:hypothetical protein LFL96_00955 [Paraburkholderia sp. D15]|uniref:hypothetical protein n=1 Tax=Paraburkholderia sp. D15 TaxID=2880218 RepID=UPI00247A1604|nr:hypothetical protein [Paraburkholderia sp. D15]WGS50110.1 hypothetical protein LFL96_00955 [Paraburkholderia sp. D15]